MFRGASKVTLDAKGRMAIPTRHRAAINDGCEGQLVVTVDPSDCLLVYPLPVWEELERRLIKLPALKPKSRSFQRMLMGYATEVEVDAQGRILVSKELREFAGITRNAMLMGQGNKFELWDEEKLKMVREAWVQENQGDDDGELPAELETLTL